MNDPWPRFRGFVFCTMIFVVFGTLMSWTEIFKGEIKGIDEPVGKIVFVLAVIAIALILTVQKLDLRWIAKISCIIGFCLIYYLIAIALRYDISTTTMGESSALLGEGLYFTLISTLLTIFFALLGYKNTAK